MEQKFLEFVADIMGVNAADLSLDIKYKEFEKWDSLMMLNLIMELEEEYDISISLDTVGNINTLNDLFCLVNKE